MTEQTPEQSARLAQLQRVWANLPGIGTLAAVNHTSIGLRFMITGAVFFLIGGVLAMLVRTQLALPEQDILSPEIYNQVFTMHGTVMMFLFAIPILEGFAIYMIPKMIGARDLVFPRISSLGYYCYLFGGLIILSSLVLGIAPDAGWFMYTPLSGQEYSPGPGSDFWLLGITFVEISAMAAGIELTVSILRSRANGMSLTRMPLFCWYILAMSLMIVFGFPPLILASVLLEIERAAGLPFFEVAGGGDPVLWQHLFWLFGHPEVYIIFLPAAAIVSTLIPVFAQRPIVGYRWIVLSIILTGFISFGLWVHHMFTVGIPHLAQAFFSVASMLVAVPTAIQVFAWLATLWSGRVIYSLPMLWIIGFLVVFVCGGLTGVMLALVPFNWQVHDTHFVVAHLHYVVVGGMFFPLMAGLYYWLPLFSGRQPSQRLGRLGFWLTFTGFNVTFLLMHLTGLLGMPRRIYTYEAGLGWDWLNLLSSVGGFIMAAGIAVIIVDVALHLRFGRPTPRNPWKADTLEWSLDTPPPPYNFASLPPVRTRHPLHEHPDLQTSIAAGEHGLPSAEHGRREIYGSDAVTARVREIIHLPTNSWLPLLAALSLAVVCVSLLVRVYEVALLGVVGAAVFLLRWSWVNGAHPQMAPLTEDEPVNPPLHSRTCDGPGLWGMVVTLMANGALYLSLLFGWFYLWTVAPNWSPPDSQAMSLWLVLASGIFLTLATFRHHRIARRLAAGGATGLHRRLWQTAVLGAIHVAVLIGAVSDASLAPTDNAHDAVLLVMCLYLLFHGALCTVLTAMQAMRAARGYVSVRLPYEPQVLRLLWLYTLGVFWLSAAAFLLLPPAWSGA
ncbi:cytochrome c oxidase subunit I [Thioalkalivibrio denitrificans]|uniref:cytochrome-c oxidase n=1 Tax=Thioalkalivibrio denitrificans TaxID=108003 RepID=A0A1V3N7F7_9GAMM|nr:cytochrome c oxidase subunit I [Thioalkalivibrio denitrificans]OOG21017.1 cytochrome c oxidase subunit I [Thioalkalivibrio denitrificans]